MNRYSVLLSNTALRQLDKLPDKLAEKLVIDILALSDNPRPHGYKKLKDRNAFRIRKGDYRIIYEIFDKEFIVDVIAIGHRKEIYG